MAAPLFRGKPYFAVFTHTFSSNPEENGTVTLTIGSKYSFTTGNSVIIAPRLTDTHRFEAIVTSYDSSTGVIQLSELTNIRGSSFSTIGLWTITLAGERGSKITYGSGIPNSNIGRVGDTYIDTITGEMYVKS